MGWGGGLQGTGALLITPATRTLSTPLITVDTDLDGVAKVVFVIALHITRYTQEILNWGFLPMFLFVQPALCTSRDLWDVFLGCDQNQRTLLVVHLGRPWQLASVSPEPSLTSQHWETPGPIPRFPPPSWDPRLSKEPRDYQKLGFRRSEH